MLYFIYCIDKPDHHHVRAAVRPDHLEYIGGFMDQVFTVGPTISDDQEAMTGSVLIIEFENRQAAEKFAEDDPYNKAELFESVTIKAWKKVLPKD